MAAAHNGCGFVEDRHGYLQGRRCLFRGSSRGAHFASNLSAFINFTIFSLLFMNLYLKQLLYNKLFIKCSAL